MHSINADADANAAARAAIPDQRAVQGAPPPTPTRGIRALGTTGLVFGVLAVAVPVFGFGLGLLSVATGDQALSMVTALLVVPVALGLALLLGVVALVLGIVHAVRARGRDRRWIATLILAVAGAAFGPILIAVLSAFSAA